MAPGPLPLVSCASLSKAPDGLTVWIKARPPHPARMVGHRMKHEPTPETDEALDKLMVLRAWTARRLVN